MAAWGLWLRQEALYFGLSDLQIPHEASPGQVGYECAPGPLFASKVMGWGRKGPRKGGRERRKYNISHCLGQLSGEGWGVKAWIGPWSEIVGRRE